MAADILLLADALVTEFQNRINAVPIADVVVERVYEMTYDMGTFEGIHVDIYPLKYREVEQEDRTTAAYDFTYSFVVMQRYRTKGNVPKSWIDGMVAFVEEQIFNPLDPTTRINNDTFFMVVSGDTYYTVEAVVSSVYDYDFLRQHKVFWSEVEVTFRKNDSGLS